MTHQHAAPAAPTTGPAPEFTHLVDLLSERMGGRAVATNDDFFASVDNLVLASTPVFIEGKYTDVGKWMDGWESRRRRVPGHDWAIVELGVPGLLAGFDVDTAHFLGNYPEQASLEGCNAPGADAAQLESAEWFELVPRSDLRGGSHNYVEVTADARGRVVTHVRLNIFPDGGVARLRAYGTAHIDWSEVARSGERIDLAAAVHGAQVVSCNNEFFCDKRNIILPGNAANMGEGWETRRRRTPGNDWLVLRLGHPGTIEQILLDTSHYKGNFPHECSIEARWYEGDDAALDCAGDAGWEPLLERTPLSADTVHDFSSELVERGPVTHVRLSIYPDGGVARLRLLGRPWDGDGA